MCVRERACERHFKQEGEKASEREREMGLLFRSAAVRRAGREKKNGEGDGESVSQELKFIVHVCGRTWKKEMEETRGGKLAPSLYR